MSANEIRQEKTDQSNAEKKVKGREEYKKKGVEMTLIKETGQTVSKEKTTEKN